MELAPANIISTSNGTFTLKYGAGGDCCFKTDRPGQANMNLTGTGLIFAEEMVCTNMAHIARVTLVLLVL